MTRTSKRKWRLGCELLEGRQLLSTVSAYVEGTNGNLWLEAPGWQANNSRTFIDSNVKAFSPTGNGNVLVEGSDGNLWLEAPGWQAKNTRTFIDGNVKAFAPAANGQFFVEGTNGNLWLEAPGWQAKNTRTFIDSNVLAFAPAGNGIAFVEGTDGKLWLEAPGWQANNSRTLMDANVIAFAPAGNGDALVEGTDTRLWLEDPGWQAKNTRTFIDANVMAFSLAGYGNYFVEGTNGNLWLEAPGWQAKNTRTFIDSSVMAFSPIGNDQAFVEGMNTNLWLEAPGWQANNSRTFIDTNVMSFAANTVEPDGLAFGYVGSIPLTDPTASAGYSAAPASAPLFNNNQPSYLDVEQGAAADCWLMASLAEVAARDPQDIKNMFVSDGTTVDNGATVPVYLVRFFSTSGAAFYIKVDTELPAGGEYYDHVDNALGTQALWVALAEKGYAEANAFGLVTTGSEYQDSYSALNYGDPAWALHAITGNPANDSSINPTYIASAWNSGQLIVMCTGTPASSYIVGNHCYAVVGYNASSGDPFEVFNPWGTQSNGWAPGHTNSIYGLFNANAAFLSQNFKTQSIGTGATITDDVMGPIDEFAVAVTLDNAKPRNTAIVHGNGNDNDVMAVRYTRPATVATTDSKPLPW